MTSDGALALTVNDQLRSSEETRRSSLAETLAILPQRDEPAYRFRNTISFWIAVSFTEGSLLYCVAYVTEWLRPERAWVNVALVTGSLCAGSVAYTFGAYLAFVAVISVGNSEIRLWSLHGSSPEGYFSALFYFVGALVPCVWNFVELGVSSSDESQVVKWVEWVFRSMLPGVLFVVAYAAV